MTWKTQTFYAVANDPLQVLATRDCITHADLAHHGVWHYEQPIERLELLCSPMELASRWILSTPVACNNIAVQRFWHGKSSSAHAAMVAHALLADRAKDWVIDPVDAIGGAYTNATLVPEEVTIHGFTMFERGDSPRGTTTLVIVDVPLSDSGRVKELIDAERKWRRLDGSVRVGEVAWHWPSAKLSKRNNEYGSNWVEVDVAARLHGPWLIE